MRGRCAGACSKTRCLGARRAGVSSFGVGGTNVNELTGQALTDLGAAPTFYDCVVQVEALAEPVAG